jgi:hypothetical protein
MPQVFFFFCKKQLTETNLLNGEGKKTSEQRLKRRKKKNYAHMSYTALKRERQYVRDCEQSHNVIDTC